MNVTAVVSHSYDKVKQVFMDDPDSGEDFTADTDLNAEFSLSGTVSTVGTGTTVTGFGTKFLTEVRAGDVINIAGIGDRIVASNPTTNDSLTVTMAWFSYNYCSCSEKTCIS